uniref:Uncharacterized protein n=1 Tax=Cyprinus carpio carpio TaxID=630221 RepID=A0A8C1ACY8_CYPCA
MMKASCPVNGNVCLLFVEFHSPKKKYHQLTSLHLLAVLRHVVWADGKEELDVIVTVILGHFFSIGFMRPLNEVVGHADSVGFHGMTLAIVFRFHQRGRCYCVPPSIIVIKYLGLVPFTSQLFKRPPIYI